MTDGMTMDSGVGQYLVRQAVESDIERLLEIQKAAYLALEAPLYGPCIPPLHETAETIRGAMDGADRCVLVVEDAINRRPVGSVRVDMDADSGHISRMNVDPDHHGRGCGRLLFVAAETEIQARGGRSVRLEVGERSASLRRMYERWGYAYTGEKTQVPGGPLVLFMRRGLGEE